MTDTNIVFIYILHYISILYISIFTISYLLCLLLFYFLGAVSLLVLCLQEPELYIKQISASAISDICKHSTELAQAVVDTNAIPILVKILNNPDIKAKVI